MTGKACLNTEGGLKAGGVLKRRKGIHQGNPLFGWPVFFQKTRRALENEGPPTSVFSGHPFSDTGAFQKTDPLDDLEGGSSPEKTQRGILG
jgi:hypothetical protein